jgi:hypothetical protein
MPPLLHEAPLQRQPVERQPVERQPVGHQPFDSPNSTNGVRAPTASDTP